MCGITGAVWNDPERALPRQTLQRMIAALRHRGPDDEGGYAADYEFRSVSQPVPGVALGHRRLAIIDVAGGHQPLSNEDGSIWIVFNGEIYNFAELRRRLEGSGHVFRTQSDTETLVHLYEDLGADFLQHVNGMFALALWDARRRQLLLARDRLGEKPLVYRHEPGRILFGSELKAILAVDDVPRRIEPAALDAYLTYQYVPPPQTILHGINKLPPGHVALYREGRLTVRPYWNPDFTQEVRRPWADDVDELRQVVRSAVRMRLQSEVPLGAFLSGGVDSSIVVALMRELSPATVRTFSIGFPVPEYDETAYARQVAAHLGTQHEEFRVAPDAVEILPRLVWHFDEPFADSSAVPTWYLAQLARRQVTVALTGDGGDELFAGYPRYRAVRLASYVDRLPQALREWLGAPGWRRIPTGSRQGSWRRRFLRFVEALALPPDRRYLEWISIFNEARRASLYSDAFLAALPDADPLEYLRQALARCAGRDPVTQASLADLTTYLPSDLMTKVDIAAMAHGLETRPPLLDYRVVELAARMPIEHKYQRGRGKRILQAAFGSLLPPVVFRRRKMGFGVPLDRWFRYELKDFARDVLFDPTTQGRGYFRPEAVRVLWEEHQAGRFDHSYRLWALVVLELWQREWRAE